jgi:DNA-directed RNA polymerase beta' subunit
MKTCEHCKKEKPKTEFWKNKKRPDGLNGVCRECYRVYDRKRYYKDIEASREKKNRMAKKMMEKHPEKWKARSLAKYAVKIGVLKKEGCKKCGDDNVHAHHDDYKKPLQVIWLCPKHHAERHREIGTKY